MRDPNDTRDIGPRIGSPLWNYITAVTVAGLAALLVAVRGLPGSGADELLADPLLWVVAALALLGELKRIVTPGKSGPDAGAISVTFCFAALLYWGFPVAALLRAVTTLVVALSARRAVFRALFNVAQLTLSLAAAAAVLAAAHVHPSPSRPWVPAGSQLAVVGLAAAAYFACNFVLVGVAVALHGRAPALATLRKAPAVPGLRHAGAAVRGAAGGRGHAPLGAAGAAVPAAAERRLRQRGHVAEPRIPGAARPSDRPAEPYPAAAPDGRGPDRGRAHRGQVRLPAPGPGPVQGGQRHARPPAGGRPPRR